MLLVACGRDGRPATDSAALPAPATQATSGATAVGAVAGTPACPHTGAWSLCTVVERLERSGLVPRVDSALAASEPPLAEKGSLIRLGRGELEVYLYTDAAARERATATLDTTKYL